MEGMVVFVTIPQKSADSLVKKVLRKKLVACINVLRGVDSYFWWKGKIETEKEALLIMKTKRALFSKLEKEIKLHHPYTVPEIVGINISRINKEYLHWLLGEVVS